MSSGGAVSTCVPYTVFVGDAQCASLLCSTLADATYTSVVLANVVYGSVLALSMVVAWHFVLFFWRRKGVEYVRLKLSAGDGEDTMADMPEGRLRGSDESKQLNVSGRYFAIATFFAIASILSVAFLFLPGFSPVVQAIRFIFYNAHIYLSLFIGLLLFFKAQTRSRRNLLLAAFISLVSGTLAITLVLVVSGEPHLLTCCNCPLFWYGEVTPYYGLVFFGAWFACLVLLLCRRVRRAGRYWIIIHVMYSGFQVVCGFLINSGMAVPLCIFGVVHLLYLLLLPWVLLYTTVRDSHALSFAADIITSEEGSSLLHHDPTAHQNRVFSFALSSRDLPYSQGEGHLRKTLLRYKNAKTESLSERERVVHYMLNNLDPSIDIVEFDEVEKQKKVGAGGFGEVYKGRWRDEEVAIKRVFNLDMKKMKVFLREINVMSRLQHPNITRLIGVAVDVSDSYLLTEFVERGSLFDLIHKQRAKISLANMKKILMETAVGMAHLHGQNPPFLHRDLKSQNLLIEADWRVKICDFGMSRVQSLAVTMTKLGTLQWVAPEVLRDERYSEKADIYSYGILIWELVARKVPYVGQNSIEVAQKVAYRGLRPRVPSSCPIVVLELMRQCWDNDADSRPSFREIIGVIEEWPPEEEWTTLRDSLRNNNNTTPNNFSVSSAE